MSRLLSPRKPTRPAKRHTRAASEKYGQLRVLGALMIFGSAAVATALGFVLVHAQFEARDYEMEARRLQEVARERHDESKKLQSRIGGLKRGEMLREAALGPLGMIEPPAAAIGQLSVDPSVISQFERAEFEARKRLAAERERLENFKKEDI